MAPGFNYRTAAFPDAKLRVKLRHLDCWTQARRAGVNRYNQRLAGSGLKRPTEMPWHGMSIISTRCDQIVAIFSMFRCKKEAFRREFIMRRRFTSSPLTRI